MKVVVTGGGGFLGSHVADALSDAGHEVVIFDRQSSPYLRPDQRLVIGDVLKPAEVEAILADADVVYHMAALADINEARHRPRETIEINVIGTLNILEAARIHGLKRVVFASSIYVYSNQGSFYRTSKQACENLIHDFWERYGLAYTILRFGSLYGPRADASNAVFNMLRQALQSKRIQYPGTGEEIREYIHVLDAAAMSVDILELTYENQIIHLTGRERLTTRQMLEMIREMMGGGVELKLNDEEMPGHYVQTPYNYTPRLGQRLTRKTYIDLGLGLLDLLQHLDQTAKDEA